MTTLVPVADVVATSHRRIDDARDHSAQVIDLARSFPGARRRSQVWTMAGDVVSVALAALVLDVLDQGLTTAGVLGLAGLWLLLLAASHGYESDLHTGPRDRARAALRAGTMLGLACWVVPTFVVQPVTAPALMVLTVTLVSLALITRVAVDYGVARAATDRGASVLVAGTPDAVARTAAAMRRARGGRWSTIAACVTAPPAAADLQDVPVNVGIEDLDLVAASTHADAVLVLPCPELDPLALRRIGWRLEAAGTPLYVGTGLLDVAPRRTSVFTVGDLSLMRVHQALLPGPARFLKAVTERLAAAVLLIALAPLLAGIALAVRWESPGPAIFRQRRVGRDGCEFTMYKYRTMDADAEDAVVDLLDHNESEGAVLFKIRADPRITRVGGFLRRYSLDELPQLVNVLIGEMSLVGPRPALPSEVARYDLDPHRRLAVRPGLTGLWQVSGRSDLCWEETVRLDLHYVDNWSFGLDVAILLRTARAVFGHSGAY